jgi:E3 ubiquitin-protein ligase makorin
LLGNCLHGARCQYAHRREATAAEARNPTYRDLASEAHLRDPLDFELPAGSGAPPEECGICFAEVTDMFGLLDCCGHAYHLGCIRGWREKGMEAGSAESVRRCPVCRVRCHLVLPSAALPRSASHKAAIVAHYRASTQRIPCRHFSAFRDGSCPFGTSCLYAHLLPDGSAAPVTAPRLRQNGEGHAEALKPVLLSDVLFASAKLR